VPLDRLEAKLRVSAAFVEVVVPQRQEGGLIGEGHEGHVGFGISEPYLQEIHRIIPARVLIRP
jgi:hypothetical protein